ncbi:MAG: YjcQ family protein [Lachnospiraceae bacterium]|nr:YjcQ family protein [Lachnospiraceae bacterium]
MDNFKVIYKILKILEKSMDLEEFDKKLIGYQELNLTEPRWNRIIAMMVSNGLISGVDVRNTFDCDYPKVTLVRPEITLKGLEYLEENSTMRKIADAAKGITEVVTKIH